jgi:hypothetical protein
MAFRREHTAQAVNAPVTQLGAHLVSIKVPDALRELFCFFACSILK